MSFSKQLKLLLHPYFFVLKEGKSYATDSMSYDLLMLQISNEVIKSPINYPARVEDPKAELEALKAALPNAIERVKKGATG